MDARYLAEQMIDTIRAYGISDERIFAAMRKIPRHFFVPEGLSEEAYADSPLPIGDGQTISQPYTVAFMIDQLELRNGHKVLEIGAGSGWNAALMQHMIGKEGRVISVERFPDLAELAKENLKKVYSGAHVVLADGSLGYPPHAPYDRIVVTAASPKIPEPLVQQLNEGGIIIAPVGKMFQQMIKVRKEGGILQTENLGSFRFVPLIGKHGFQHHIN
jgi:protein-L-isoaspartate(D-aspartate) O-methyltransferase